MPSILVNSVEIIVNTVFATDVRDTVCFRGRRLQGIVSMSNAGKRNVVLGRANGQATAPGYGKDI